MAIRVAIHHETEYSFDRLTTLYPHVLRLRPAPHSRTKIHSYSLKIGSKTPLATFKRVLYFPSKPKN
jgi:transglutaminase-like putative cysteine protease